MGIPGEGLARRIPGVSTLVSITSVRIWVAELRAFGLGRLTDGLRAERDSLVQLMDDTGFEKWARFWHYGRTMIPLTMRLFCEQVFSDRGKPWSELVTGFGPIRGIINRAEIARIRKQETAKFTGFKRTKSTYSSERMRADRDE